VINVSIIVPVYNSEKSLKFTLDSLVKGSLSEIEIIAIDDASTDRSFVILKEYEKAYPEKVKVYQNKSNIGQGATRNRGIKLAKGKYIGFVDSDDYVNFRMYEVMYNGAVVHNFPEVVTTGLLFVKGNYYLDNNFEGLKQDKGKVMSVLDNPDFILEQSPSACNKIFRTDTIKGNLFLEGVMWEDVAFSYAKMFNANNILVFNSPNYFYRRTGEGVSGKGFKVNLNLLDIFKVADKLGEEVKNSNRYDLFASQVKFLQITTCLQRVVEIMNWSIDKERSINLCRLMGLIIMKKYGDWREIPIEKLSARVGLLELEKINKIMSDIKVLDNKEEFETLENEINNSLRNL